MAYSCCFSKRGNLDFLDFLQKKFYNINSSAKFCHFGKFQLLQQLLRVRKMLATVGSIQIGGETETSKNL